MFLLKFNVELYGSKKIHKSVGVVYKNITSV